MGLVSRFIADNQFKQDDLAAFKTKLFFEGTKRRVDLERFAILLFLSTAIATYGVIGDSVATVIGAMIIAPLMRPIMAIAAGLVMGDVKRAARSLSIVFVSVIGVIGLSWLLAELSIMIVPVISFQSNSQIISRVSPRLIDLYAALWSGAAAAFAMSREDVADSLPGAAIAIALVPPLCVAGIGLAEMQWNAAGGAALLFITNFLSILLAGGAVLALLGLNKTAVKGLDRRNRRNAYLLVAIAIIMVVIPLGRTTINIYQKRQITREAIQLAYHWMSDTDYNLKKINVTDDQIILEIHGSGERPILAELGEQLGETLGQPVKLSLIVVPSIQESYEHMLE